MHVRRTCPRRISLWSRAVVRVDRSAQKPLVETTSELAGRGPHRSTFLRSERAACDARPLGNLPVEFRARRRASRSGARFWSRRRDHHILITVTPLTFRDGRGEKASCRPAIPWSAAPRQSGLPARSGVVLSGLLDRRRTGDLCAKGSAAAARRGPGLRGKRPFAHAMAASRETSFGSRAHVDAIAGLLERLRPRGLPRADATTCANLSREVTERRVPGTGAHRDHCPNAEARCARPPGAAALACHIRPVFRAESVPPRTQSSTAELGRS